MTLASRCAILLLVLSPISARGQDPQVIRPAEPDISSPVWGGIAFGGMGFLTGAYVGSHIQGGCHGDDCGLEQAFLGAAIGGTFGMALGVHVGNRNRGDLGLDFLAGAGVWVAGMAIGSAVHWRGHSSLFILTAIPVMQMVTTVSAERSVGRRHDRDRDPDAQPSLAIFPTDRGGVLSITVPLPRIR